MIERSFRKHFERVHEEYCLLEKNGLGEVKEVHCIVSLEQCLSQDTSNAWTTFIEPKAPPTALVAALAQSY
jgi:hypothetical protein